MWDFKVSIGKEKSLILVISREEKKGKYLTVQGLQTVAVVYSQEEKEEKITH